MPRLSLYPFYELRLMERGFCSIVGVDEVGRGAVAGPMVVAGVMPSLTPPYLSGVFDSKSLNPLQRQKLADLILQSYPVGIGSVNNKRIDTIGLSASLCEAIQMALHQLLPVDYVLMDGKWLPPNFEFEAESLVKGDQRCYAIACASIVAKVYRDKLMTRLNDKYSCYDWAGNKGYGTKNHLEAIKTHGLSRLHRRSFLKKFI